MGTLKAKQIKRDWARLPSQKAALYGSCKITARQYLFVCKLKSSWQLVLSCCEDTGQVATGAVILLITLEQWVLK